MEVTGKIIKILEPKTGTSSHGKWQKQEIIIETEAKYNNKICLVNWNEKLDISSLKVNDTIRCIFDASSKEYKNNWYTELRMTKIEVAKLGLDPAKRIIINEEELKDYMTAASETEELKQIIDQSSQNSKKNPVNTPLRDLGLDPSKQIIIKSKEELEDYLSATPATEGPKQDAPINIEDVENSDANEKLRYLDFVEKILKSGDKLSQVIWSNKDIRTKKIIEVREVEEILDDIFDKKNPLDNYLINHFNKVTRKPGREEGLNRSWFCLFQSGIRVLLAAPMDKIPLIPGTFNNLNNDLHDHFFQDEFKFVFVRKEEADLAAKGISSFLKSGKGKLFPELIKKSLLQSMEDIRNNNEKVDFYLLSRIIVKRIMLNMVNMI